MGPMGGPMGMGSGYQGWGGPANQGGYGYGPHGGYQGWGPQGQWGGYGGPAGNYGYGNFNWCHNLSFRFDSS